MATVAPSAARRFAIAAPIPREPPVTSATFLANLDIKSPFFFVTDSQLSDAPVCKRIWHIGEYKPFQMGMHARVPRWRIVPAFYKELSESCSSKIQFIL